MTNTVLIEGKGLAVGFDLYLLSLRLKENAHYISHGVRWWQLKPRHSIRIQNVNNDQLRELTSFVHVLASKTNSKVNLEIF